MMFGSGKCFFANFYNRWIQHEEAVSKAMYYREDGKAVRKRKLNFNTFRLTGKCFLLTFETASSQTYSFCSYPRGVPPEHRKELCCRISQCPSGQCH